MNYLKTISPYFGILALLIPLLFLNQRETHDWGGDFAQYIQQGLNIVELSPQEKHHYIFNEEHPMLGPELYPIGFPLLLAPVLGLFGNDMPILILYMNFWLIACAMAFFSLLKIYYKTTPSILIVLLFSYTPWFIIFKSEVMADLPFLFFLLLCIQVYIRKGFNLLCSLLIISAILIKALALSFLLAILLNEIFSRVKRSSPIHYRKLILIVLSGIIPSLIQSFIFKISNNTSQYLKNFSFGNLGETVARNFELYYQPFDNYLNQIDPSYLVFGELLSILLFSLLFIGLAFRLFIHGPAIFEFYLFTHLAVLVLFPSQAAAERYLLPLLPILLIFVHEALLAAQMRWALLKNIPLIVLVLISLSFTAANYPWIERNVSDPLAGPQEPESKACFEYLKEHIPKDQHVVFKKPRVLGLYTGINSYSNEPYQSLAEVERKYLSMNSKYFLTNFDNHNAALEEYFIPAHKNELILLWSNSKFKLFEWDPMSVQ